MELDENNNLKAIIGEPENENLGGEEISIADNDLEFSWLAVSYVIVKI